MSLMSGLYVGTSGLQTGQNALNTTAHNLTNMDTIGYVRQQVSQADRQYNTIKYNSSGVSNQQVGLGTYYARCRQVRDYFLDRSFRKESGKSAFYEVSCSALENVEDLLGEMEGKSFSEALSGENGLWGAIQELSKNPAASVGQGLLVHKAYSFIEQAKSVYQGLADYQDNLNLQIKQNVDKINSYAKKISQLNEQIRKIQMGGTESPNDLLDARNQILDELAVLGDIKIREDLEGNVAVQFEGVDLVKKDIAYEIGLQADETTGFYTPFWKQNAKYTVKADGTKIYDAENAKVFNTTQEISDNLNTNIGSLKSMVYARGDKRGNYTDLEEKNYTADISQSVLVNIQAEFDSLIHSIATKMNQILKDAAESATAKDPNSTYLRDSEGNPLQLFTKIATSGYDKSKAGTPGYDAEGYMIEQTDDPNKTETYYSVLNLQINPDLLLKPSTLDFIQPDGSEDLELGKAMKAAFQEDKYYLNPNTKSPCNFTEFYSALVSQVGYTGAVNRSMRDNQQVTVEAYNSAREQVIGVSSEEELSNMIKFQNAYNASSRYINVIDEMLEHILTTLGA